MPRARPCLDVDATAPARGPSPVDLRDTVIGTLPDDVERGTGNDLMSEFFPTRGACRPPDGPAASLLLELLRDLSACVGVYAPDGTCLGATASLGGWLEQPADSLVGLTLHEIWPGDFARRQSDHLREALAAGPPRPPRSSPRRWVRAWFASSASPGSRPARPAPSSSCSRISRRRAAAPGRPAGIVRRRSLAVPRSCRPTCATRSIRLRSSPAVAARRGRLAGRRPPGRSERAAGQHRGAATPALREVNGAPGTGAAGRRVEGDPVQLTQVFLKLAG